MSYHIQKSALLVPEQHATKPPSRLNFIARCILKRKRDREIHDSIEEARLFALLLAVPPEKLCAESSFSERRLQIDRIWFGNTIDHQKVANIFKCIGKCLLRQGYTTKKDFPKEPVEPEDDNRQRLVALTNDNYLPAEVLQRAYDRYPILASSFPRARTWYEVKLAAATLGLWRNGKPLETDLREEQMLLFVAQFGILRKGRWKLREKLALRRRLWSSEESKITVDDVRDVRDWKHKNHFVVAGLPDKRGPHPLASVKDGAVMRLGPLFFCHLADSIRNMTVQSGRTKFPHITDIQSFVFLHEASHLWSVLGSEAPELHPLKLSIANMN